MKLEISEQIFEKKPLLSNFMKISPVGTELLHADRRKDRHDETKLRVTFHNFAKAPNTRRTSMPSAGFQIPIPAIKRLQTYASDRRPPDLLV
jgi:hypothetical protein